MEELLISPYLLAAIFLVVATLYSSVGLGGGSSYTALLAVFGASYQIIPTVSLSLNLVVTTIGSFNYIRKGHARLRIILPFVLTSIPMSYVGGSLHLPADIFYAVLLATLVLVAARIYLWSEPKLDLDLSERQKIVVSLLLGSLLGLIAGIVGIGGGIYLVPIIMILGLGTEKEAAATGAVFIALNSMAGLAAHFQRQAPDFELVVPLIVAVVCGAFVGSHMGAARLSKRAISRVLGVVILIAIGFLIRNLVS